MNIFNLQLLNDIEQNPSEIKEFNKSEENIVLKTRLEQANQMIEKLQVIIVILTIWYLEKKLQHTVIYTMNNILKYIIITVLQK